MVVMVMLMVVVIEGWFNGGSILECGKVLIIISYLAK